MMVQAHPKDELCHMLAAISETLPESGSVSIPTLNRQAKHGLRVIISYTQMPMRPPKFGKSPN